MGGTSYIPIEKYLERNPQISKLTLCLDSDDEGHFFSQKIRERFDGEYEICSHVPKGKDFNEELLISNSEDNFSQNVNSVQYDIIGEDFMV